MMLGLIGGTIDQAKRLVDLIGPRMRARDTRPRYCRGVINRRDLELSVRGRARGTRADSPVINRRDLDGRQCAGIAATRTA